MNTKSIIPGSYVKDKTGLIYLVVEVFDVKLAISSKRICNLDALDIVEVRKGISVTNPCTLSYSNWGYSKCIYTKCVKDTFLGVSLQADNSTVKEFDTENCIKYDTSKSLETNNAALRGSTYHKIIPPASFASDHIIGEGLYNQIMQRRSVGKDSFIYDPDSTTFKQVKKVYELKGNDRAKFALVVF